MSDYAIMPLEDLQTACNAIRTKTGTSDLIKSGEMAGLIEGIEGGGNTETCTVEFPESANVATIVYADANGQICTGYASNGTYYDGLTTNRFNVLKNSFIIFVGTTNTSRIDYFNGWKTNTSNGGYYLSAAIAPEINMVWRGSSSTDTPVAFFVDRDIVFGYEASNNEPT